MSLRPDFRRFHNIGVFGLITRYLPAEFLGRVARGGNAQADKPLLDVGRLHHGKPLDAMVAQRRFRQDLYYRVNIPRLAIPALRDRPGDIAPWLPRLTRYAWPGNVRELENISERIAAFLLQYARAEDVDHDALRHDCPELYDQLPPPPEQHGATQRERALQALRDCGGNRLQAARRLGVSRSTLWRWAKDSG